VFHVKRLRSTCDAGTGATTPTALYCTLAGQILQRPTREYRPINAFSVLFACLTGVIHASLAPLAAGSDMRPSLILAAVTAATVGFGLEVGAVWAFVGGLTANLLTTDPLGTLPLGLLLVAGLITIAARLRLASVILAAFGGAVGSVLLASLAALWLSLGVDPAALPLDDVVGIIGLSAVLNGALAVAAWLPLRAILGRLGRQPALG